ncbi:MAG: zinc-ribbon domain-containing protein [Spirochaetes bacterium]|jgi:predicted Zn finger-like uncharacterized protein|nr:zinc-ribbon domain-containing protein [Spirochaetota bacterium]
MIVKCSNCESAFTVSDEKVNGKKFAFGCPNCSHNNIIDNRESSVTPATTPAAGQTAMSEDPGDLGYMQEPASPPSDNQTGNSGYDDPETEDDDFNFDDMSDTDADLSTFEDSDLPEDNDFNFDAPDEADTGTELSEDVSTPDSNNYDNIDYEVEPEIDLSVLPSSDYSDETTQTLDTEDDSLDDEITVDLDSLEIDLESDNDSPALPTIKADEAAPSLADDDYDFNEESEIFSDNTDNISNSVKDFDSEDDSDLLSPPLEEVEDDFTIDLDSLAIDLEEDEPGTSVIENTLTDDKESIDTLDPASEPEELSFDIEETDLEAEDFDNDLSIDIDNLDIDLDEIPDSDQIEDSAPSEKPVREETPTSFTEEDDISADTEDDINIDLDSLDIELEEDDIEPFTPDDDIGTPRFSMDTDDDSTDLTDDDLFDDLPYDDNDDDEPLSGSPIPLPAEDYDDDITIDLDSLNADLDEEDSFPKTKPVPAEEPVSNDETIDLNSLNAEFEESNTLSTGEELFDEDETISIDLDTLDLDTDEPEDATGEDDEARLSLSDAGLTLDEIEIETGQNNLSDSLTDDFSGLEDDDEEELHLTADEVNINLDDITDEDENYEDKDYQDDYQTLDDIPADELPELDLDRLDDILPEQAPVRTETDIFDIATPETATDSQNGVAGPGYIQFSVDYSLRYSRIKALLKLLGVYYLLYIPHFLVFTLYFIVASVLTYINSIIILFTSHTEKDFTAFQEKTLRCGVGLSLSVFNITEELPPYAGATDIDYQLQLHAHPPVKFSKFLALMRLSGVGIMLLTAPHIIILSILSCAVLFFHIVGLISVIFTRKWPSFFFDFMVRFFRYYTNIVAFITGVVDSYPSFRFD